MREVYPADDVPIRSSIRHWRNHHRTAITFTHKESTFSVRGDQS